MNTMTTLLFLALSACINAAPIHTLEKRKGSGGGSGGKGGGGGSKSSSHTSSSGSSSSSQGATGTYTLAAWKIILIVFSVLIFIGLLSLGIWLCTKKNKGWWKVKQQTGEKKKFKVKKAKNGGEIPSGEEFEEEEEEEEEQARAGEVEQEERKEEEAQYEWENHE